MGETIFGAFMRGVRRGLEKERSGAADAGPAAQFRPVGPIAEPGGRNLRRPTKPEAECHEPAANAGLLPSHLAEVRHYCLMALEEAWVLADERHGKELWEASQFVDDEEYERRERLSDSDLELTSPDEESR